MVIISQHVLFSRRAELGDDPDVVIHFEIFTVGEGAAGTIWVIKGECPEHRRRSAKRGAYGSSERNCSRLIYELKVGLMLDGVSKVYRILFTVRALRMATDHHRGAFNFLGDIDPFNDVGGNIPHDDLVASEAGQVA